MQTNWQDMWDIAYAEALVATPSSDPYYQSETGVAYWQWADSFLTRYADPTNIAPSVLNSTDTVTGYVEYSFFHEFYCDPSREGALSEANWAFFQDTTMWNSKLEGETDKNMEYLFDLEDPETGGDPVPRSLFNLETL